jgi:AAA family ATP:ADP antiporter
MSIAFACCVGIGLTHAYIMKRAHDADGGKQYDLDQAAALKAREDHAKDQARVAAGKKPKKDKTGLIDALKFVARTPEVLCLAVMSICQGLSSILFQVRGRGS